MEILQKKVELKSEKSSGSINGAPLHTLSAREMTSKSSAFRKSVIDFMTVLSFKIVA
jgi:hypothetical protein